MREEILEKLTPITSEERKILDGDGDIDRALYMDGQGDMINIKKLIAEGKLIDVRPHTRFVHFPEHTHDFVEVIYMCQGQTIHIVNGNRITLKTGELLFLTPDAKQEILPAGENDIAVNFIISTRFFDNIFHMIGHESTPLHSFIISILQGEKGSSSYMHFAVSDVLPIQNLVENLIWTLIYGAPNKRNINQSTMGLLLLHLINNTDKASSEQDDALVLYVLRYIENNYKAGSLSALAEELHYDFTWLSREIKERVGKTYTDLVQEKRLAQAKYLLKNTKMKIIEIANETGYDNISYFHRLFRNQFGVSPKKYRDEFS